MTREEGNKIKRQKVVDAMKDHQGVLRTAELYEECGLNYRDVDKMVKSDFLVRIKSGYYGLKGSKRGEEEQIAALFPDGVLCMESALFAYGYLKERPFAWKIAVDKNTSKSRFLLDVPVVVPYYTEGEVLKIGVTEIKLRKATLKIYDRDRLICDCLKYEHKMDRKDYKAALQGYIADPKKNVDHLMAYAKERKVLSKVQNTIGVWL